MKGKMVTVLASAVIGALAAIGVTHTAIGKAAVTAVADAVASEAQACGNGNGKGGGKGKGR